MDEHLGNNLMSEKATGAIDYQQRLSRNIFPDFQIPKKKKSSRVNCWERYWDRTKVYIFPDASDAGKNNKYTFMAESILELFLKCSKY